MLRKQRTVAIPKTEIDFIVQEFYCHDSAVLKSLGSHHQEMRWNIVAGLGTPPVELKIMTDGGLVQSTKVGIICGTEADGRPRQVFPPPNPSGHIKEKLKETVRWSQKFRGSLKNLNIKNFYEVRQMDNSGQFSWYQATVTHQRNEYVEAVLLMPNPYDGQLREVNFPAVPIADVREVASKNTLTFPERVLSLEVPKDNPLHATVAVDNEPMSHFFGRPTPPPGKDGSSTAGAQRLKLKVDKYRKECTGNFGAAYLTDFLKTEVQLVERQASRLKHTWKVCLGQTAEHVVEIEKKWKSSKIVTVNVDGTRMVEAKAEDLDCATHEFVCNFRLVGERFLDFEVHETNMDGAPLDSTGVASTRIKVVKECSIRIPNDSDLQTAVFMVNDVPFDVMQERRKPIPGDSITIAPEVFLSTYGFAVPYKINEKAHVGLASYTDKMADLMGLTPGASGARSSGSGFSLFSCCIGPSVDSAQEIRTPVAPLK